ncbi:Hydroxyethylthiazole kinase [Pseudovibrio axinellae]|uniref:hydroxyethylthiazole kinase n=1 Tax=Pseudovibrio axinellae TaxID=989403 RepID=A0A166APU2_9HYPH|nr:hydroxyethylthiazole kinase [Pseudovibrio axinellae]KZL21398.1 Hydroxyethylthiazole kinase [Pseudovibrio axinellae]SEQ98719.1 hydroxyethylthiazole kinase [Pseudovibrio axinellae]
MSYTADDFWQVFENLRARGVRVHCLTNSVAQNITANVMLACNIVPSMTASHDEIPTFIDSVDGLLVNLGTLDGKRRHGIRLGLEGAIKKPIPVVLDPVKVDRSDIRMQFARDILAENVSILKANQAEYEGLKEAVSDKQLVVRTGQEDLVFSGQHTYKMSNGHVYMDKVTGIGCALGGVMAGFAAVEPDQELAMLAALAIYGVCGEIAAEQARGPGSFTPAFLDTLYGLQGDQFNERLKLEIINNNGGVLAE